MPRKMHPSELEEESWEPECSADYDTSNPDLFKQWSQESRPKAHKQPKDSGSWQTPEMRELWSASQCFPWTKILGVVFLPISINTACTGVQDTLNDMHMAWEMEQPIPTRSEYAEVPIIGRMFQFGCDIGDVVRVNSGFLSKYASALPWVAMSPVVAVAAPKAIGPALAGMALTKAAVVSVIPLVPMIR